MLPRADKEAANGILSTIAGKVMRTPLVSFQVSSRQPRDVSSISWGAYPSTADSWEFETTASKDM